MLLKISTAQTVVIGPILDADGAAVTTAVVTNISIAKNGSAAALTTETLTHLANGYYTLALTSGNTNTLGNLEVFANNTAMSMTVFRYNVIAAQVYDSIVSGSDLLQVDIQQLENSATNAARILIGASSNHEVQVTASNHVAANIHALQAGVITAADFAAGAITSTVLAADSITSSQIAASAVTEIANALSGTGARTVSVTVNDGATAIQSATVRMTAGAETYTATTNVSGVAVFNLDDATYTVAITKSGYSYAGTTLVVDGNETITYSMTVITITPSSGSLVTGYWTCYSELGAVESGVTVTLQAVRVPSESGLALDSAARTATSAANGVAQFTNLIPGATYRVKRGSGDYYTIKISDTATGTVALNSILGT